MPVNIPKTDLKRIVIVGAGFGGLKLARELLYSNYQIVLIDKNNYHQFQPLFYQVATAGLEPSAISFPLRKVFQKKSNFYIRVAEVYSVDNDQKILHTSLGTVWYDYLVIATGVNSNFFGNTSIESNAVPMKSVSEAMMLRNRLLQNFEKAVTIADPEQVRPVLNVVVVGGGPTGVEVSGAIAEMKKFVLPKDYPELDFSQMEITLIEASDRLLASMSKQSSAKAIRYLKKLGVKVVTNNLVTAYDGETVWLGDGTQIKSKTLIWAAGIKGDYPNGFSPEITGRGNRLKVDAYNRVESYPDVFAIGDVALMATEKYPNGHPQVAQVAIQQGKNLALNFVAMNQGIRLIPFKYIDRGSMATIGRNRAVVDLPFWSFGGLTAWMIWMFIHLMAIVGVKNRLLIFINWLWNYITYDQSLRLILKVSGGKADKKEPVSV